jgi:hypothetical protein
MQSSSCLHNDTESLFAAELSSNLTKALLNGKLSVVDRIALQNDAFALAKAGIIPTTQVV